MVGRVMAYPLSEYPRIPRLLWHPRIVHSRQSHVIPLVRVSADTMVTLTSRDRTCIVGRVIVCPLPEYPRIPQLLWDPGIVHSRQSDVIPHWSEWLLLEFSLNSLLIVVFYTCICYKYYHSLTISNVYDPYYHQCHKNHTRNTNNTGCQSNHGICEYSDKWYNITCQSICRYHGYSEIQGSYIICRVMLYHLSEYLQIPLLQCY